MLNVVMLSVIRLNVIMLSLVVPIEVKHSSLLIPAGSDEEKKV